MKALRRELQRLRRELQQAVRRKVQHLLTMQALRRAGAAEETAVERAARRELRCRGRQAAFHSAMSVRRFRFATGVPKREA